MTKTKVCPDCGDTFYSRDGDRYCVWCRKKRRKSIRHSDWLTPLPRYRPPRRRDERGIVL